VEEGLRLQLRCGLLGEPANGNPETDAVWAKYREDAKGIGKNIKDIPNLGDDAFSMETESFGTIYNVSVRKGTRFVYVASRAPLDQEIALARTLL